MSGTDEQVVAGAGRALAVRRALCARLRRGRSPVACIALAIMALGACGSARPPRPPEAYMQVGVDPAREAAAVIEALEGAGFELAQRIDADSFIALAFVREDGRRAIRVVTRVGVAVALDSHETDGVRVRHGEVRLVDRGVPGHDLDGDGRPEVVLARAESDRSCLAILHLYEDGRARAARIEAENVAPGSCASALEDVDGDGRMEAIVEVEWRALAITAESVPSLRVALAEGDGGWRAGAMPAAYEQRERSARRAALVEARARLDVASASRLGVELAALLNLAGAPIAAQVRAYDEAVSGLVLAEAERDRVRAVRGYIAAGWAGRESADGANTRAPSLRHEQEEERGPG